MLLHTYIHECLFPPLVWFEPARRYCLQLVQHRRLHQDIHSTGDERHELKGFRKLENKYLEIFEMKFFKGRGATLLAMY